MNFSINSITSCRLCQHYNPEGRRGGLCGKLDVPVLSTWDACSLATHPFLNESFHDTIALTQGEILELQEIKMRSLIFAE